MTSHTPNGNTIRPLRNVAALVTLLERLEARGAYLPGMAAFYGFSGYGKTFAATHACRVMDAIHVEVREFWTRKSLCSALLKELSIRPAKTLPAMFDQLVDALSRTSRPLLIDEADHLLRQKMIELVRALHDSTQTSVVLIGEEEMPQKLQALERVHGRMFDWVAAQPADLTDTRQLAVYYAPGIEISDELMDALNKASRGSTRRVSTNLARVAEEARLLGRERMGLSDWGLRGFYTGEAPLGRKDVA